MARRKPLNRFSPLQDCYRIFVNKRQDAPLDQSTIFDTNPNGRVLTNAAGRNVFRLSERRHLADLPVHRAAEFMYGFDQHADRFRRRKLGNPMAEIEDMADAGLMRAERPEHLADLGADLFGTGK